MLEKIFLAKYNCPSSIWLAKTICMDFLPSDTQPIDLSLLCFRQILWPNVFEIFLCISVFKVLSIDGHHLFTLTYESHVKKTDHLLVDQRINNNFLLLGMVGSNITVSSLLFYYDCLVVHVESWRYIFIIVSTWGFR